MTMKKIRILQAVLDYQLNCTANSAILAHELKVLQSVFFS